VKYLSISGIIHNKVLVCAIIAWIIAQTLKVIIVALTSKRFDYTRLVGSGGMPSSHSALVMALSTKTGMVEGFSSTSFALAICFALVVMYDAAGVRRAAGNQARILNNIMKDLSQKKPLEEKKLKELLGHTPVEVFAGAILGIAIGIIV
jgi:acid phosphatase family membrane protein YuiD